MKLVIVLDEFQWMVAASPELPSVIQELWDRRWRSSGKVLLILCGSYVGFMEREVLAGARSSAGAQNKKSYPSPAAGISLGIKEPRCGVE